MSTDVDEALHLSCIETAVQHVEELIDRHAPIDAIAGICDGAVVSALVAARHSHQLQLWINFCGGPPQTRLPPSRVPRRIDVHVPSLHFIGSQDELFTTEELMALPRLCSAKIAVVPHAYGHQVPPLSGHLLTSTNAFLASLKHGVGEVRNDGNGRVIFNNGTAEDRWGDNEDEPPAEFDSMAILSKQSSMDAWSEAVLNGYALAIIAVVLTHTLQGGVQVDQVFVHTSLGDLNRNKRLLSDCASTRAISRLSSFGFLLFTVFAGVKDARSPPNMWAQRISQELAVSTACMLLLFYTTFPDQVQQLYESLELQVPAPLTPRMNSAAWWPISLLAWRMIAAIVASVRSPRWIVPVMSVLVHLGSFGTLLPWPLVRSPLHLWHSGRFWLSAWLPTSQPPLQLHFFWMFYAVSPWVLGHDFPVQIPFGSTGNSQARGRIRIMWAVSLPLWVYIGDFLSSPQSGSYASRPYICSGSMTRESTLTCIRALLDTPLWDQWSLEAAIMDILILSTTLGGCVALVACLPLRNVTGWTTIGVHSLGIFMAHLPLAPLFEPISGQLIAHVWEASGSHNMVACSQLAACVLWVRLIAWGCAALSALVHTLEARFNCLCQWRLADGNVVTVITGAIRHTVQAALASLQSAYLYCNRWGRSREYMYQQLPFVDDLEWAGGQQMPSEGDPLHRGPETLAVGKVDHDPSTKPLQALKQPKQPKQVPIIVYRGLMVALMIVAWFLLPIRQSQSNLCSTASCARSETKYLFVLPSEVARWPARMLRTGSAGLPAGLNIESAQRGPPVVVNSSVECHQRCLSAALQQSTACEAAQFTPSAWRVKASNWLDGTGHCHILSGGIWIQNVSLKVWSAATGYRAPLFHNQAAKAGVRYFVVSPHILWTDDEQSIQVLTRVTAHALRPLTKSQNSLVGPGTTVRDHVPGSGGQQWERKMHKTIGPAGQQQRRDQNQTNALSHRVTVKQKRRSRRRKQANFTSEKDEQGHHAHIQTNRVEHSNGTCEQHGGIFSSIVEPGTLRSIGILNNHGLRTCCPKSCGQCGGSGCKALPGGRAACCSMDILNAGRFCKFWKPPCILRPRPRLALRSKGVGIAN